MNGSMYLASRFLRLGAGNVAQRQGTCSVRAQFSIGGRSSTE